MGIYWCSQHKIISLWLYIIATKPPYKLQGFSIGARKQDKLYVSLIDGSTQSTFSALVTPDGTTSPADSAYTNITHKDLHWRC